MEFYHYLELTNVPNSDVKLLVSDKLYGSNKDLLSNLIMRKFRNYDLLLDQRVQIHFVRKEEMQTLDEWR